MADKTKIEWCDATWNPITGCTPCSPGCAHCYARTLAGRFPQVHGGEFAHIKFHPDRLNQPMHWRRPRRVFVCSMGDLFHGQIVDDDIADVYRTMALCPQHTFLLLTKRPERAHALLTKWTLGRFGVCDARPTGSPMPLPNVWLGVTICNQAEADAKIPVLLRTPAALRFVSIEPMLGPVHLKPWWLNGIAPYDSDDGKPHWTGGGPRLDWVICGGETGPGARPMCLTWAHDLCSQCQQAGVPFFFKGHGTYLTPKRHPLYRVLDGRKWNEFPTGKEG